MALRMGNRYKRETNEVAICVYIQLMERKTRIFTKLEPMIYYEDSLRITSYN